MSTGSVRSCPPPGASVTSVTFAIPYSQIETSPRRAASRSDVQEPDVPGVARDERPARLDVLAHQDAEQLVGLGRVVERHLPDHPPRRVPPGLPPPLPLHPPLPLPPLPPTPPPPPL